MTIRHFLALVCASGLVCSGCENKEHFSGLLSSTSLTETGAAAGTRVVIEDSFERPDSINQTSGWTTYIYDALTATTPLSARKFGAAIFTASQMGPAADGTKSLYFFGKSDSMVHEIYLVSPSFNLADLQSVAIAFKYLIFSLNDAGESDESLKFEVCNGNATTCGLGATIDPVNFRGSSWISLFQHSASLNGNSKNGINHSLADWVAANFDLQLGFYNPALPFTFRFSVKLRDGFSCHKQGDPYTLLDGAAIDAVSLVGTIAEEGGEGPPQ